MQSAKKIKMLSALSMAAAATFAAKSAHGATLSLFYGQDTYANSNNNIVTAAPGTFNAASTSKDTQKEIKFFTGAPTTHAVSQSAPTTITIAIGGYVSLALDAVLTGNPNNAADAGTTNQNSQVLPNFLGLSELATTVSSTNANGSILQPLAANNTQLSTFNAQPTFASFSTINVRLGSNVATDQTATGNPNNGLAPVWGSVAASADMQNSNGNAGLNGFNNGGNSSINSHTTTTIQQLGQFGASSASYGTATDFVDAQVFQGLSAGTVTLTPNVVQSATQYWVDKTPGVQGGSQYVPQTFSTASGDVLNNLPVLVIVVTGGASSHSILSLAATAAANSTNYGSTVGALHITGSAAAGYTTAQVTGLSGATGNVTTDAWNATSDPEIYGVDVKVNGVQATPAQLTSLLNAIAGDGVAPASAGVTASTNDLSAGGALAALDTASTTYNLFLKYAGGGPSIPLDDLGIDLSNSNDSNLVGYTFSAVAVVPEPMTLGLLALGGVGLMSRRRRKA